MDDKNIFAIVNKHCSKALAQNQAVYEAMQKAKEDAESKAGLYRSRLMKVVQQLKQTKQKVQLYNLDEDNQIKQLSLRVQELEEKLKKYEQGKP